MQITDIILLGILAALALILLFNLRKFLSDKKKLLNLPEVNNKLKNSTPETQGLSVSHNPRFFTISYALRSIWTHKKRFLNLSVGFIITVALITMLFVFIEVAPQEAVVEAIDERPFHLIVDPIISSFTFQLLGSIPVIQEDPEIAPFIESAELVMFSQAIFGIGNKSLEYTFYPEMEDPDDPVFISENTELFIVRDSYLQTVRDQFELIEGNFTIDNQNIVISKRLIAKIQDILPNETIACGSYVDFNIITRVADLEHGETELKYWEPYPYIENNGSYRLRVAGIFDRKTTNSVYYPRYYIETLGDCLFLSESLVPDWVKLKLIAAAYTPRVFIRLDKQSILEQGTWNAKETIAGLKDRIYARSQRLEGVPTLIIHEYTDEIYGTIDLYANTRIIVIFTLLPMAVLSVLFVSFTARTVFQGRKSEIENLRSKGADLSQLRLIFLSEISFVSVFGSIGGLVIGFLLGYAIKQATGFLLFSFSFTGLSSFYSLALASFMSWFLIPVIVVFFLLFYAIQQINKFLETEFGLRREHRSAIETFAQERYLDISSLILGFLGLSFLIETDILIGFFQDPAFIGLFLLFTLIVWFGLMGYAARIIGDLTGAISNLGIIRKIFGVKMTLVLKNIRRRRTQIISMTTILCATFSICIFASVFTETVLDNTENQIDYAIGSDYKIFTDPQNATEFKNNLEQLEGISQATPILNSFAAIGQDRRVTVLGINPSEYLQVANWDESSFNNGQNAEDVLQILNEEKFCIIINELIAQRLELSVGSNLTLEELGGYNQRYNFIICGIIHSAPGFGLATDYDSRTTTTVIESLGTVFIHEEMMRSQLFNNITLGSLYLARGTPGTDRNQTLEILKDQRSVRVVYAFGLYDTSEIGFLALTGVAGILSIDYLTAILVSGVTLTLFLSFIVDERRQEYAIMHAFGAHRRHIFTLIIFEALVFVTFSFGAGLIIGVLFSWLFSKIALPKLDFHNLLPLQVQFPLLLMFLTSIIVLIALLIGSILPARRAASVNIALTLKNL
ncbi:MAG: FtsX-like permease family protein [Promethearchaeota archaeon]